LYHWQHGPSRSRIGQATIGARDIRIENQFGPRLTLRADDTQTAITEAQNILRRGGMVGFRGVGWANRPAYFPLFNGTMQLAFGAPSTAKRAGAALFTASVGRTDSGFRVAFERIDGVEDRSYEDIGAEFCKRLETAVRASPSLWQVKTRQWRPGAPPITDAAQSRSEN